MEGGGSN